MAIVPSVSPENEVVQAEPVMEVKPRRNLWVWTAVPGWAISLIVHLALLMILAAISLEPVQKALAILTVSSNGAATEQMQSFDISDAPAPEMSEPTEEPVSLPAAATAPVAEMMEVALDPVITNPIGELPVTNVIDQIAPSSLLSDAMSDQMTQALSSRSSNMKKEMLEKFGGTAASEQAVARALAWIAAHQLPNGAWSFGHDRVCRGQCGEAGNFVNSYNAATAVALLPFLGAGQTHLDGQYKDTVKKGLAFLIKRMEITGGTPPRGSWHEANGNMYSHGLAAIAVCEAYAMTKDPDLEKPAQLALNYISWAQDPRGGGWRYSPQQPGDTSVVGWQLMALKSGLMGGLTIYPETVKKAGFFLDSVQTNDGAYYGYDAPSADPAASAATTSIGLLCRMYMGWPKEKKGVQDGVKFIAGIGPSKTNVYYNYYATQVLRQYGGAEWDRWNEAMRNQLVDSQEKSGHAAGSWFDGTLEDWSHEQQGGRLYCTAMSTMILEVYYRYMPLYGDKSTEDDFEL
jgi:hypothetical protein